MEVAMYKLQRGFMLIELVIVIVIIGILVFVFGGVFSHRVQSMGEQEMRSYVAKLYPMYSDVRVICSNADTDSDGYVRCTSTGMYEGKVVTTEAECAASILFLWRSGCVPIKAVVRP